jgi:hypothetical protein
MGNGVSVAGLGAGEVEPAVKFAASVVVVWFELAGRAGVGAGAADAPAEFSFGLGDGVDPVGVPAGADGGTELGFFKGHVAASSVVEAVSTLNREFVALVGVAGWWGLALGNEG